MVHSWMSTDLGSRLEEVRRRVRAQLGDRKIALLTCKISWYQNTLDRGSSNSPPPRTSVAQLTVMLEEALKQISREAVLAVTSLLRLFL